MLCCAPAPAELPPPPAPQPLVELASGDMLVTLTKDPAEKWQVLLDTDFSAEGVLLSKVRATAGPVQRFNKLNPGTVLENGDLLKSVNGETNPFSIVTQFKTKNELTMVVLKREYVPQKPESPEPIKANIKEPAVAGVVDGKQEPVVAAVEEMPKEAQQSSETNAAKPQQIEEPAEPAEPEHPNFSAAKWLVKEVEGDPEGFLAAAKIGWMMRKAFKAMNYGKGTIWQKIEHNGDSVKVTKAEAKDNWQAIIGKSNQPGADSGTLNTLEWVDNGQAIHIVYTNKDKVTFNNTWKLRNPSTLEESMTCDGKKLVWIYSK